MLRSMLGPPECDEWCGQGEGLMLHRRASRAGGWSGVGSDGAGADAGRAERMIYPTHSKIRAIALVCAAALVSAAGLAHHVCASRKDTRRDGPVALETLPCFEIGVVW